MTDQKGAQFPADVPSRKYRVDKRATIPPMTQTMVRVATPGGELCFLQTHPKTAHKNLCLMAQGVMDLFSGEPFTALVRKFGHPAVYVPKHTVVGLALPSPTHTLKLGVSAPGEADAKEGGGNKNKSSITMEECARQEEPAADDAKTSGASISSVVGIKIALWENRSTMTRTVS